MWCTSNRRSAERSREGVVNDVAIAWDRWVEMLQGQLTDEFAGRALQGQVHAAVRAAVERTAGGRIDDYRMLFVERFAREQLRALPERA